MSRTLAVYTDPATGTQHAVTKEHGYLYGLYTGRGGLYIHDGETVTDALERVERVERRQAAARLALAERCRRALEALKAQGRLL